MNVCPVYIDRALVASTIELATYDNHCAKQHYTVRSTQKCFNRKKDKRTKDTAHRSVHASSVLPPTRSPFLISSPSHIPYPFNQEQYHTGICCPLVVLMAARLLLWFGLCLVVLMRSSSFVVRVASSLRTQQHQQRCTLASYSSIHLETRKATRSEQYRFFATRDQPSSEDLYNEFTHLAQEIRRHDALYYNDGNAVELSDDEYNALVQKEAEYCQAHPEFLQRYQQESGLGVQATRYGGRVGSTLQEPLLSRRTHLSKMLSLDNVHSQEQLFQWLARIQKRLENITTTTTILTEPKLDGLSLSLRYSKNETSTTLQWAATRGDGTEGQDVTQAVRSLQSIPQELTNAPDIEVRGEVIMPTSAFQRLSNFSNARNAASGILLRKAKEQDEELQSQLRFYAYDIVCNDESFVEDGIQLRSVLVDWGFQVPEPIEVTVLQVDTEWNETRIQPMLNYYNDLEQHRQGVAARLNWDDYEMDGVVHKVSERSVRAHLGNTNRSPRWAIAHKFPPQTALTSLTGLDVQVGRTGALTPVALLEPVDIGGVSVKRATLHNFGHLVQLMGSTQVPVGTKVLVRRAGDVIPQVVQRVLGDAPTGTESMISLEAPSSCPACGSATKIEKLADKNSTDGQVVRCGGPPLLCPPRAVGALAHAFSRNALDITGLSEARIQQLLDAGFLRTPADVFQLVASEKISSNSSNAILSEIAELPGWGPKSAQNLANVVSQKATDGISLARFIYSLGIRHAGEHTSKLIASAYGTADVFLTALEDLADDKEGALNALVGTNETEGTKGIGPAQVASLTSFAKESSSLEAARNLAKAIPIHEQVTSGDNETSGNKPWQGYTVVFTGSLPNNLSRSKAQELARQMGAKSTPGTVSKSTDLVVAGEKGGKKLDRALALGVRVMESADFVKLVQEYTTTIL